MEEERLQQIEETQPEGYLTFALGVEAFGINIKNVTEIIGVQPITHLPAVPEHIKGIVNLRGRVIPVIDMRLKFGMEEIAYNDRTCVVVVEVQDITVGLIVDSVMEVCSIDDALIVPPPESGRSEQAKYIFGIARLGEGIALLLDVAKLLLEGIALGEAQEA